MISAIIFKLWKYLLRVQTQKDSVSLLFRHLDMLLYYLLGVEADSLLALTKNHLPRAIGQALVSSPAT